MLIFKHEIGFYHVIFLHLFLHTHILMKITTIYSTTCYLYSQNYKIIINSCNFYANMNLCILSKIVILTTQYISMYYVINNIFLIFSCLCNIYKFVKYWTAAFIKRDLSSMHHVPKTFFNYLDLKRVYFM